MLIAVKRLPYSRNCLFVVISRRAKHRNYGVNGVPIALDIQIVKQIEKLFNLLFIVRYKDSLNLRHKVLAKEIQIQKVAVLGDMIFIILLNRREKVEHFFGKARNCNAPALRKGGQFNLR